MTKEDFKIAYNTYKQCIIDQVLIPEKLREAYYIVTGIDKEYEPVVSIRKCKGTIYNFFQYHASEFMKEFESFLNDEDLDETEEELNSKQGIDSTRTNLDKNNKSIYMKPEDQSHQEGENDDKETEIDKEPDKEPDTDKEPDKEPETVKYTGIREPDETQLENKFNYSEEDITVNSVPNNYTEIELEKLEKLYEKETDSNKKRSLKMKINNMRKKL